MDPIRPKNFLEFTEILNSEESCNEYLYDIRWEKEFVCPSCNTKTNKSDLKPDKKFNIICINCKRKISITAGTIMHGTHLSTRYWLSAMWLISTLSVGISARNLQKALGLKRYESAFILHRKIREATVRMRQEKLRPTVELDIVDANRLMSFKCNSNKLDANVVIVAVESNRRSWRRIRFLHVKAVSPKIILSFVNKYVHKNTTIQTNDRNIFSIIGSNGYKHKVFASLPSDQNKFTLRPRARIEIDRVRKWLSTTHRGRVSLKYLQSYLDEYAFRHNRRLHDVIGHTFFRLVQQAVKVHHELNMSEHS